MDNQGFDNKGTLESSNIELNSKSSANMAASGKVSPISLPNGSADQDGKPKPRTERIGSIIPQEVLDAKEAKRKRAPLWYCRMITTYPKTFFFVTLGFHIFFVLITMALLRSGYDILPVSFTELPLDIRDNVDYLRDLAWTKRNDFDDIITRVAAENETIQEERTVNYEYVSMYFEEPGRNVFTKENLKRMQKVEDAFFNMDGYQTDFCQLNSTGSCIKPTSVLRYFDGSKSHISPVFNDPNFDNVTGVFYEAFTNVRTKMALQFHLGKDAVLDGVVAQSVITRCLFPIGAPLKGYLNKSHEASEQEDKVKRFMFNTLRPIANDYFQNGVGPMDFFYSSSTIIFVEINNQVITDMSLALGSFAFIFLFMCIQTQSLWVSGFAVLSIMTGFCCANLIYRCILDFRFFGLFHILAIFIILGIGADDVFVFFDTWKETGNHKYLTLGHRMSDCYRKAAMAMLFTSLTTAIAFIVSASSPFLGISTFGVFAGVLVLVNYVSVIIFFPTVVVMYHLYFEKYKCCCCCAKNVPNEEESEPSILSERKHPVVRFCRGPFYRFITHKVARWIILVFYLVLLVVFIAFAAQLKVNEEQVKFMPDHSNLGKVILKSSTAFGSRNARRAVKINIVWGLEAPDLSSCHRTDPECKGVSRYDSTFNLNTAAAQNAILSLCNTLKGLSQDEIADLHIQTDLITGKPEVSCFAQDLKDFLEVEQDRVTSMGTRRYPAGTDLSYPVDKTDLTYIMNRVPIFNASLLNEPGFNNYFEVATSFWLYNGFDFVPGTDKGQYSTFEMYLGEVENPPYTTEKTMKQGPFELTYTYGSKMRYAAITINTTINGATLGFPMGLPIRDKWENWVSNKMSSMPEGLKNGFQSTGYIWHWLKVQETLASSAYTGIIIGICLAFPILVIATANIIVGLLATLTICCITISVIGVIPMAGWKLGVLESLNLVLVVGLAVDYVVHLAEGYSRSAHTDRLGRTRDTLEEVGISVLSGAITTIGASFFLLFAQVLFFTQFGVFMFCTIGFSILYALGLFTTVMALIGPENNLGSLKPLFERCCLCCNKSGSTTITQSPPNGQPTA